MTKVLSILAAVAVLATSAQFARTVADAPANGAPLQPVTANILAQLRREGLPRGPILVRFSGDVLGGLYAGLVDGLALRGADVLVDPSLGFQFGYGRVDHVRDLPVWYVVEDSEDFSLLSSQPGARVLAQSRPLSSGEQAELVSLQMKVLDQLPTDAHKADFALLSQQLVAFEIGRVPGVTPEEMRRLTALNEKVADHTCLCGVIAFAPGMVPSWAYVPGPGRRS